MNTLKLQRRANVKRWFELGSRLGRQLSDVSEVIIDSTLGLWSLDRDISPQKLIPGTKYDR